MLAEARGSSLCGCPGTQAGDTPSQAQVPPEPPPLGFLQEEPGASATVAALEEEHEEPQQADEGEEERGREKVRGPAAWSHGAVGLHGGCRAPGLGAAEGAAAPSPALRWRPPDGAPSPCVCCGGFRDTDSLVKWIAH